MDILIEELNGSLWVAALERKKLIGLEIDAEHEAVRWGSIYWARVIRIDASLDAAFLDLDGENKGILYNRDVRITGKDGIIIKGGNVAIGKLLSAGQMILVQAKAGYLPKADDEEKWEDKTPVVSMAISLPGRYLIYTPYEIDNRISQRIRDRKLRSQLLAMVEKLEATEGCILRAAAANTQTEILVREGKLLRLEWDHLLEHAKGDKAQLILLGPDAISRTLSDQSRARIDRIEVVTMDHFQAAEEWCELFAPDLVTKIRPIEIENAEIDLALFDHHGVMEQVVSLFQPYALMISGGNMIFQDTAAFMAIDVNSGADKRSHLALNIEAAVEIARQLRLRNQGGAVLVDFLKMPDSKDKKALLTALQKAVDEDPCTVHIHGFTRLGLVEMTRARRTPSLHDRFEGRISD